jgi:hypothetical protein
MFRDKRNIIIGWWRPGSVGYDRPHIIALEDRGTLIFIASGPNRNRSALPKIVLFGEILHAK